MTQEQLTRVNVIADWKREEILRCCRAAGITAHAMKDNRSLAKMLVRAIDHAKRVTERVQ